MKQTKLLRRISVAIIALMLITMSVASAFAVIVVDLKKDIAVTSGNVEIVAEIENWEMHSLNEISMDNLQGTKVDRTAEESFISGGTASYDEGQITLNKIVPGDGVSFNIKVTNNSNVAIKYRAVISATTVANLDDSSENLADVLAITIYGKEYVGSAKTDYADKTQDETGVIDTIPVTIDLPVTAGEEWMNKSVSLSVTVEAVQSNIYIPEGATNLSELKADIANGKGTSADNPLTIIGGEWGALGDFRGNSTIEDCHLVINDGKFNGSAIFPYARGSVVTINGGSFEGMYLAFHADASGAQSGIVINITEGVFDIDKFVVADSQDWTVNITGGTFTIDPTAYVVDGYTANDNGDGTWTVVKNS